MVTLLTRVTPVSITINNQPTKGWFWGFYEAWKATAVAHPYITYAVIGVAAGSLVYFVGWPILFTPLQTALRKPRSSARAVQTNRNLRDESEQLRYAIRDLQDNLTSVKYEVRRVQADVLETITQRSLASDKVLRETRTQVVDVQHSVIAVQESLTHLVTIMTHTVN